MALTGSAAFNRRGHHGAMRIYVKHKLSWTPLSSDVLNTLRVQYKDLKFVIVDETSLISYVIDQQMDCRLRKITGVDAAYGGLHLL